MSCPSIFPVQCVRHKAGKLMDEWRKWGKDSFCLNINIHMCDQFVKLGEVHVLPMFSRDRKSTLGCVLLHHFPAVEKHYIAPLICKTPTNKSDICLGIAVWLCLAKSLVHIVLYLPLH